MRGAFALGIGLAGASMAGGLAWSSLPARAEFFSGFYRSSAPVAVAAPARDPAPALRGADCLAAILDAQARYDIPDNMLLAIGIQEAGRRGPGGLTVWPWTVNAAGEGAFFNTRDEALTWVRARQQAGIASIDVGCMQVNQKWHGGGFVSLEQAFDPAMNVDYAARFLLSLFRESGDWWKAAGRYHSATETYSEVYLSALRRNHSVVNAHLGALIAQASTARMFDVASAEAAAPQLPPPPVYWSSDAGGAERFSIYSNRPMQPVLPAYRTMK
ncbi:lytic transglycosylase domain-containing protein [Antarcticimicrobium luteum]|uniref:Lytic transglycosylase domain-containing protein n=1 Tax=Antarcticimicrobium luteum TaxID=2547397 RepID=A0A4R5VDB0_9RHOB|nr:lytic transglycosylase domain-containing protein [Antarcticimicrobium luteum]TDK50200.1 lytic transglycosylase domain-containing protein [Antarcticimicrobium luteum]